MSTSNPLDNYSDLRVLKLDRHIGGAHPNPIWRAFDEVKTTTSTGTPRKEAMCRLCGKDKILGVPDRLARHIRSECKSQKLTKHMKVHLLEAFRNKKASRSLPLIA